MQLCQKERCIWLQEAIALLKCNYENVVQYKTAGVCEFKLLVFLRAHCPSKFSPAVCHAIPILHMLLAFCPIVYI